MGILLRRSFIESLHQYPLLIAYQLIQNVKKQSQYLKMQNPENQQQFQEELALVTTIIKNQQSLGQAKQAITQALSQQFNRHRSDSYIEVLIEKSKAKNCKHHSEQKPNQDKQQLIAPLFKSFNEQQDDNRIKIQNIQQKKCKIRPIINYRSTRKIQPLDSSYKHNCALEERLKHLEEINEQCTLTIDKFDRKFNKKMSFPEPNTINNKALWFYHEYFYSNYDRKFFQQNHFKAILQYLNLSKEFYPFKKHKDILRSLPRPNLFDQKFLMKQKSALQAHRNVCRQKSKLLSRHNQSTDFAVHNIVLALHPLCGHLHLGSILAFYKQNQYMVKFVKPELPTFKISDTNMSTEFTISKNKQTKNDVLRQKSTKIESDNQISQIVENFNYDITSIFIKILALKSDIIRQLTHINDRVQQIYANNQQTQQLETIESAKVCVSWLTCYLDSLQILIKNTVVLFRMRCTNQQSSKAIMKNISNLLLNPLKLMSKQFENSSDEADIKASSQIRQIFKKQRQKEAMAMLAKVAPNCSKQLSIKQQKLLRCCLLMLADLKGEGKQFDLRSNQNLTRLVEITTDYNLRDEFNEAYEKIYGIVNKMND